MKNCPQCQSDQIKKVSLIHAEGVKTAAGLGLGVSGGGIGAGVGVGVSTSALASSCTPPKKEKDAFMKKMGHALMLVFFVPLLMALFTNGSWGETGLFWKVWAGLGLALMAWQNHKFDKQQELAFQHASAEYEKTFMCLRCGHFYKPFE